MRSLPWILLSVVAVGGGGYLLYRAFSAPTHAPGYAPGGASTNGAQSAYGSGGPSAAQLAPAYIDAITKGINSLVDSGTKLWSAFGSGSGGSLTAGDTSWDPSWAGVD